MDKCKPSERAASPPANAFGPLLNDAVPTLLDFLDSLGDDVPMNDQADTPTLLDFLDSLGDDVPMNDQADTPPVGKEFIPSEEVEDKRKSTIPISTKNQPKPKTKSNTWRQRQRLEMLKLRDEVKQLDAELKKLKLAGGVRSTVPLIEDVQNVGVAKRPAVRKLLGASWEDAASRESLSRQITVTESERLHRILRMQVKHARKLHRMMTRQMTTAVVAQALGRCPPLTGDEGRPPTDNNEVFRRLLTQLDGLHGCLSSILVTDDADPNCRIEGHVWINRACELQVRIATSYAIPFSVQAVEEAIWDIFTMRDVNDKNSRVVYGEIFEVDSTTTLQSMRTFIVAGQVELCFLVRKGCRKFVKVGQMYFVTHEAAIVSSTLDVGVSYDEVLCRIVKSGKCRAGMPTAIIETHVLATFPTYKTLSCLPSESLDGFHESFMRFNHKVENILIEKERRRTLMAPTAVVDTLAFAIFPS